MATPGFGHKSYLQFAKESSTYGVYTAPTKKVELVSWNVMPVLGNIPDSALYNKRSPRGIFKAGRLYRGTFVCRMNYDGLTDFLRAVTGSYAGTTVETGCYQHLYKEGTTGTLTPYTFEVVIGDIPTTKCFRLLGVKFAGVTFKVTAGTGKDAMVSAEFNVVATDMTSDQTPATITDFPVVAPVLFHQTITMDDGTADAAASVRVRSIEVSLENALADDRWFIGSAGIDEPIPNGFVNVKWKVQQEFATKTLFDAARACTATSPLFLFRDASALISATKYYEFELRSGTAYISDWSVPIDGPGILISTATHEAVYDPTDLTSLYMRLQNKDTTLT